MIVATDIVKGVTAIMTKDFDRKLFDALIPLPKGTTYNSYLVQGSSKTALIDTTNPGFEPEFMQALKKRTDLSKLDYLVMNHAEPDHANAIPLVLDIAKNAKLVTSKIGAGFAKDYYGVPESRILIATEELKLELGGKTLRFIDAPWLHWPETIFTYLVEDRILFPCDFFGQHYCVKQNFSDEVDWNEVLIYAKRYFGEIMMPFRPAGRKALEKLSKLKIALIAPSHGIIYRNPEVIQKVYARWTAEEPAVRKALVVHVSMWGSSKRMAEHIADVIRDEGVTVELHDALQDDLGEIAADLVDSAAIILSAPTVLNGVHPLMLHVANTAKALRPPAKFAAVVSSYGWGEMASKSLASVFQGVPIEILGAVSAKARPKPSDLLEVEKLGKLVASKIKETVR